MRHRWTGIKTAYITQRKVHLYLWSGHTVSGEPTFKIHNRRGRLSKGEKQKTSWLALSPFRQPNRPAWGINPDPAKPQAGQPKIMSDIQIINLRYRISLLEGMVKDLKSAHNKLARQFERLVGDVPEKKIRPNRREDFTHRIFSCWEPWPSTRHPSGSQRSKPPRPPLLPL